MNVDRIGRKKDPCRKVFRKYGEWLMRKRAVACILRAGISGALDRSRRSFICNTSQHPAFSTESLVFGDVRQILGRLAVMFFLYAPDRRIMEEKLKNLPSFSLRMAGMSSTCNARTRRLN
jgi:hypothetical protein